MEIDDDSSSDEPNESEQSEDEADDEAFEQEDRFCGLTSLDWKKKLCDEFHGLLTIIKDAGLSQLSTFTHDTWKQFYTERINTWVTTKIGLWEWYAKEVHNTVVSDVLNFLRNGCWNFLQ